MYELNSYFVFDPNYDYNLKLVKSTRITVNPGFIETATYFVYRLYDLNFIRGYKER